MQRIMFTSIQLKRKKPSPKYINIFLFFFLIYIFCKIQSKLVSKGKISKLLTIHKGMNSRGNSSDWITGTRNKYSNKNILILFLCFSWMQDNNSVFCWRVQFCCTFEIYNRQHLPQKGKYSGRRPESAKPPRDYVGSICMRHLLLFWEREERIRKHIFP